MLAIEEGVDVVREDEGECFCRSAITVKLTGGAHATSRGEQTRRGS